MFRDLADTIAQELSGHRGRDYATEIHRTDRFSSFDRYRLTAQYCAAQMRQMGLEGVELHACRADGRTAYGDWLIPRAWDARDAILRLADTGHVLARYPDVPACLSMYSAPTPAAGIDTDVVPVDDLERLPEDLDGRIVFYSGRVNRAARQALAARGVAGIVYDRGRPDLPDLRGWDNYMLAPRNEEGLFAFSLSFREAEHLRARCRGGRMRVHARVDTRLYDGTVESVTGCIPGVAGDEEVLILAHLYEQGANDNASGAGLSLEVLRALKALIDRGALPRPRRTMRVLLGFECCGFMGYVVDHMERLRRTVAAINPDMIGEDQELCASSFGLQLTPGAAPSCVDALAVRLFEDLLARPDPLFRWRRRAYGVCDSLIADPTIGVPSVSIMGLPDRFYHSSLDTPDKMSPLTMARMGVMLGTYLHFLADAGVDRAAWLAEEAAAQARSAIESAAGRCIRRLRAGDPDAALRNAAELLPFLADRHGRAVASALRFADEARLSVRVERLRSGLSAAAEAALAGVRAAAEDLTGAAADRLTGAPTPTATPDDLQHHASRLIPERLVPGPLTLEPLALRAPGPFRWEPGWAAPHNDRLIWADGTRSVLDIWRCARLESGGRAAELEEIVAYFEFLAEWGYVRMGEGQS